MNKDVIYIEPEDDITDIITKIENSKEKIIALVPPKKANVFRSIVNIKLITKAGVNAEKTVVLVTTDPSIVKLASVTKLPVTKDLQTAPVIPEDGAADEIETTSEEAVLEADAGETEEEIVETIEEEAKPEEDEPENTDEEVSDSPKSADSKGDNKPEKSNKKMPKRGAGRWFFDHKKLLIFSGVGAIFLILILVWAFGIAPAANITVSVRTTTTNFSENATFTTKVDEENIAEGKFYLTEKKLEEKSEVEFEATGKKNVGEKASGSVNIYAYFSNAGTIAVNKGSTYFTLTNDNVGTLKYVAEEDVQLSWDGNLSNCRDQLEVTSSGIQCRRDGTVKVVAAEPGEEYNIGATTGGWRANVAVWTTSGSEMTGGSDKTITTVLQSDIDAAVAKVAEENASKEDINKNKLLATIEEGSFVINSSYKQTMSEPTSEPKVGEEVKEGKKAKLSITTTDSIYIVDKTKVEEFISEKAKLANNYKIYKMNDPFIENFMAVGEGYVGKIKTSFVSGPKVTENDVVNIIKGKGLGEARADLLDAFSGIDSNKTKINVSYPWVFSIPNNPTKITVTIEVEE